jgi:uncharacterized OB-fold protein
VPVDQAVRSKRAVAAASVIRSCTIRPGYEFPLACGLVELEEGTRLVTNIVGCEPDQIRIGMPGIVCVEQVDDDMKLPVFRVGKK